MENSKNVAEKIIAAGDLIGSALTDLTKLREGMNEEEKVMFDEQMKKVDVNKTLGDIAKLKDEFKNIQTKF